jgi:uncharacterized cupredoxin-like copper-binding protein
LRQGENQMKRINLLFLLIVIMSLATACGSPAPTATQAPATNVPATQPATSEIPATQGAAEETATTAPAGNTTQVDIKLADNTIESSLTTFQAGVPYTFVITNSGSHPHNFNITTPVSVAGSLEAALSSALVAVPQSRLGPGASVTVEYTFPDTAIGQPLEFSCLIRRHYEDGMLLAITVE